MEFILRRKQQNWARLRLCGGINFGVPVYWYHYRIVVNCYNFANQKKKIKNCDIFISAIGKANYYNKDYFRDGQILLDVGVSFIDGKIYGDIDYDSLKDLDLDVVTCRNGVGSITTLSLLESLLYSEN